VRYLTAIGVTLLALCALPSPAVAAPLAGDADDDAIVVVNGDVVVAPDETTQGVYVVDGNARIDGLVEGDVVLVAGDVRIGGQVDGDVVTLSGRARLLPRARVGGDLIYGDERPRIAATARVAGEIEKEEWNDALGLLPFVGVFVFWLTVTVSSAILGLLLLALAPRAADAVFAQARARFWTAVGIGVGVFVALPVAAFLLALTLVGLPLAIGIGLTLLPLAAVGYVTAAWALGRAIVKPPRGQILAFLAGLAILRLVALLPVLGVLVWLAAAIVGIGLLGAAIGAARQQGVARTPSS